MGMICLDSLFFWHKKDSSVFEISPTHQPNSYWNRGERKNEQPLPVRLWLVTLNNTTKTTWIIHHLLGPEACTKNLGSKIERIHDLFFLVTKGFMKLNKLKHFFDVLYKFKHIKCVIIYLCFVLRDEFG